MSPEQDWIPYVDENTGKMFLLPQTATRGSHAQKRPLGRLPSDCHFMPPQPVLSSRTLDIDKSGSRTYRSKSSSAIIEEQHRLMHHVYVNNRLAKSPAGRMVQNATGNEQQGDPKRRRFLSINGSNPQRPWTCVERPKSGNTPDVQKRARTTTGRVGRPARPATDTYLRLEVDPSLNASTAALHRAQQQVRALWRPERHLEGGGVSRPRGHAGAPGLLGARSATWLSFAGGADGCDENENEAGLVQAFTAAMRDQGDEYYTIDGTVGTHVARQLKRGDKVRVGINGHVQSTNLRVKGWRRETEQEELEEAPAPRHCQPTTPVPLCWDDQMAQEDAKVLESRVITNAQPRKIPLETRPAIVESLLSEDPLGKHYNQLRTASPAGFAVRMRTKRIVSIDGSTTQPMTNVTIGTSAADDAAADAMSVDDVLAQQLKRNDGKPASPPKQPRPAMANLTGPRPPTRRPGAASRQTCNSPTSPQSAKPDVPPSPPPSRASSRLPWAASGGDSRSLRPLTAHSAQSIDQNFDSFVVTAANSTSAPLPRSACAGRATSGRRPPPAKPTLHRTLAAQGTSIGVNGGTKGETFYIQFSHSLSNPPLAEPATTSPAGTVPPTPGSIDCMSLDNASLLEQDLNQDDFSELDFDMEDISNNPYPGNVDNETGENHVTDAIPEVKEEWKGEVSPNRNHHMAGSPFPEHQSPSLRLPDIRPYAFNIPTAPEVDEDECEEEDDVDEAVGPQTMHDRLVEQTADLLAGAIIGANLSGELYAARH